MTDRDEKKKDAAKDGGPPRTAAKKEIRLLDLEQKKIEITGVRLPFSPFLQGAATNILTRTTSGRNPAEVDFITGQATITNENLTIFIEKYNSLTGGLKASVHKLLDFFTIELTKNNDFRGRGEPETMVSAPIESYMAAFAIPMTKASKDKVRKRLKNDLDVLFNTSIEWNETAGSGTRDFARMRICDLVMIKNGNLVMNFSLPFTRYLRGSFIMQYPEELLKISEKNTNSYYFGKKLLLHRSISNNRKRGTAEIISVRALLAASPELPTYEEVRDSNRAYSHRIIEPFERDMNALDGILSWEYCNAGGAPLSEEQLADFGYDTFIECYISFIVAGFPEE